MKTNILNHGINVLKSILLAFALSILLLLIVTLILTFTPIKEDNIPLLTTAIMIISIAAGSIYMAIKAQEKGWLNGGIVGILYFVILLFLNYLFIKPFIFDIYTIGKFFISLAAGVIGGMIGVNIK